jgi:hypothetical protein
MLYGKGVVLLNGANLPNSSAIYPDDVIETKADSVPTLTLLDPPSWWGRNPS